MKLTKTHLYCARCGIEHRITSSSLGNPYSGTGGKIAIHRGGVIVGYEAMAYARCPKTGDEDVIGYVPLA